MVSARANTERERPRSPSAAVRILLFKAFAVTRGEGLGSLVLVHVCRFVLSDDERVPPAHPSLYNRFVPMERYILREIEVSVFKHAFFLRIVTSKENA